LAFINFTVVKNKIEDPEKAFLNTPCFVTEKYDGTNLADDDLGIIYVRRFALGDDEQEIIKASLKKNPVDKDLFLLGIPHCQKMFDPVEEFKNRGDSVLKEFVGALVKEANDKDSVKEQQDQEHGEKTEEEKRQTPRHIKRKGEEMMTIPTSQYLKLTEEMSSMKERLEIMEKWKSSADEGSQKVRPVRKVRPLCNKRLVNYSSSEDGEEV
jgi:hypothetical protein